MRDPRPPFPIPRFHIVSGVLIKKIKPWDLKKGLIRLYDTPLFKVISEAKQDYWYINIYPTVRAVPLNVWLSDRPYTSRPRE